MVLMGPGVSVLSGREGRGRRTLPPASPGVGRGGPVRLCTKWLH